MCDVALDACGPLWQGHRPIAHVINNLAKTLIVLEALLDRGEALINLVAKATNVCQRLSFSSSVSLFQRIC